MINRTGNTNILDCRHPKLGSQENGNAEPHIGGLASIEAGPHCSKFIASKSGKCLKISLLSTRIFVEIASSSKWMKRISIFGKMMQNFEEPKLSGIFIVPKLRFCHIIS